MPSNEQRRDAAKRKLERQLEHRAQRDRRRKQLTIVGSVVAVLLVIGALVGAFALKSNNNSKTAASTTDSTDTPTTSPNAPGTLPPLKALPATVNCTYTPAPPAPTKKVTPPSHTRNLPTEGDAEHNGTVSISMATNRGNIGLTLNPAESPCAVNSFTSLVGQRFFDNTKCHRLTSGELNVLQCGDPTGTGTGGPGYQFADEYPVDQYGPDDPSLQVPVTYRRGVVAMANGGPNTNGSQFFLVYGNSQLPPNYTIFGTIDATGLATLDKIAAAGIAPTPGGQPGDGAPKLPVQITNMQADN